MNIVLNEEEWAKDMIRSKCLGSKPTETLRRVARYYLDNNYSKTSAQRMLESFILQCDPLASLPKWSRSIEYAISRACKTPALKIDSIPVTKGELDLIAQLDGKQIKRLAFTLLCLSKYWDIVNSSNCHWVNSKDSEIMHMANINTSIRRQSIMYRVLHEKGLIEFSKKVDNTNVRVCFIEEGSEAIRVSDFRNLGYQYMKLCGEPFFECQNCGIVSKYSNPSRGRTQVYCKQCAVEVAIRQRVNAVARYRERAKDTRAPLDNEEIRYDECTRS